MSHGLYKTLSRPGGGSGWLGEAESAELCRRWRSGIGRSCERGCMRCALHVLTMRMDRFPQTLWCFEGGKGAPEVCRVQVDLRLEQQND